MFWLIFMLTIESANNGRDGVFGFVGAIVFGVGAACFAVFMGGTLGIVLAAVCGTIGLVSGIAGLAVNWAQSKKEREAALVYHQSGTVNNIANTIDKGVKIFKVVGGGSTKSKQSDTKSISTAASSTDLASNTKIISKIIKADGTTSIIEGPLNNAAKKSLKLIKQK